MKGVYARTAAEKIERAELLATGRKLCQGCGLVKALEAFGVDKGTWCGLTPRCRDCGRPVRRQSDRSRYYADVHQTRATRRNYARRRYAQNPERGRIEAKKSQAIWKARDPEGFRRHLCEVQRNRRARKKGASPVGKVDYERICRRDKMRCHICKRKVSRKDVNFDHVIPIAAGGAHSEENIAVSHSRCNKSKQAKVITLF